jgi:multiple antibiotic resistance protein
MDTFVTFLALLGPQKVLLAFARLTQTLDMRAVRRVALLAALVAAAIGVACDLAAPWITTFFHISTGAVELAAGLVFFMYAVGLVVGFHFDLGEDDGDLADAEHPLVTGLRQMLLPFVVSPIAIAATLEESLAAQGWAGRWTVAAAFAAIALLDAACVWVFGPLLRRAHPISLEILSRLLGILLAAVGVQVFLNGLESSGLHLTAGH